MELTIDEALKKGVDAHKAGQAQEADRLYTAILKGQPKHPDANHNMGVLAVGIGKIQEALPFFEAALEANSKIAQFWLSYIDALIKLGKVDDAKSVLDQAKEKGAKGDAFDRLEAAVKELNTSETDPTLKTDKPIPSEANILDSLKVDQAFRLAQKKSKEGLMAEAQSICQQILAKFPESRKAKDLLKMLSSGNAPKVSKKLEPSQSQLQALSSLYSQGQLEQVQAQSTQMLQQFPNSVTLYNIQGTANAGLKQVDAAIDSYKQAIKIEPDYAEAYYNMGNTLKDKGELEAAIDSYKHAIKIKPKYAEAHYNMGVALQDTGNLEAAIESFQKALKIKPDIAEAHNNTATALQDKGDLEGAIDSFQKALKIKPDYAEAYSNLGTALQDKGDLEAAIDNFQKALKIMPDYTEAYINLSLLKKFDKVDEHVIQMERLYSDPNITNEQLCHLSFAQAKVFEDLGDNNRSFKYLQEGNSLRKKQLRYNITEDEKYFAELKKSNTDITLNALLIAKKSTDSTPIFILGMPRSGTTLVEQIVSSHSKVSGAGELGYVERFGATIAKGENEASIDSLTFFRDRYLNELKKLSDGSAFVTDKMPHNFRYIGLICAAFPEAKIIHVKRNPAATCWSNYKYYFAREGLGYAYDLADLVNYYELYSDLMRHWHDQFPSRIYDLNYDKLTIDQEEETRKISQHIGLDWEIACLSPHKNKRSVRTASQQQVRKKVYTGSSLQWRKFESFLGGVFDNL